MKATLQVAVTAIAVLLAPYCVAPGAQQHRDPGTLIGPDDTITLVALNLDEISKPFRVGSSGELSLPLVGRVMAAGKTVEALEAEISERLKQFVREPQVTVYVSEYRSQPVTVSGAVAKPGILQLQGSTPLYSIIVQAGGPKDAGPTVTLTRDQRYGPIPFPEASTTADGNYSVAELALDEAIRGDSEAGTLLLKPNDLVTVSPQRPPRLVYITGEVNKPGAIELVHRSEVSMTQLLSMAGGFSRIARPSKTVIRHIGESGAETAFQLIDLKKVLDGKAKDLFLTDGDIVVVPSNQLASYFSAMSSVAISSSAMILGRL
ncbi:MAG: polysaccharide biosynthesis/export family protein [Candidatus Solibacter sp.]